MYFSSALSIKPSFTDSQLEFAKTNRPRLTSEANDLDDEVFYPEPIYMPSLGSPRKRSSDMQNAHLDSLSMILEALCKSYKKQRPPTKMLEECQHPASSANYWISKWVDYSDKFGFGKSSRKTVTWILVTDIGQVWDASDRIMMSVINFIEQCKTLWLCEKRPTVGHQH